jgi:hypothetical protein
MVGIGGFYSGLGVVAIGIIKKYGTNPTFLPDPGIKVQRLEAWRLVHIEPLLSNGTPDFCPLAYSGHGWVYQIVIIGQIIKIHGNPFLCIRPKSNSKE